MSLVADGPLIQVSGRRGSSSGDRVGDVGDDLVGARRRRRARSGTRVIARRPWPGRWSSTIVPVSAMPTAAAGDHRVDGVELGGAEARRRRLRPGTAQGSPGGTTTERPVEQRRHVPADLGRGAADDDGAVVLDPLDEQGDARRRGSGRSRWHDPRRPAAGEPSASAARTAARIVVAGAHGCPRPPAYAPTRRGTTPGPARAGRGRRSSAAPGPGSRPSARRPPGSVVRPHR